MDYTKKLRPMFTGWTAISFALGFFVCSYIVYPPRCGWGDNKWGDVATWVSAVGTIAAVATALWIAFRDARFRTQERYAKGLVLASLLYREVAALRGLLHLAQRDLIGAMKKRSLRVGFERFNNALRRIHEIDITGIEEEKVRISDLPAQHAIALVKFPVVLRLVRKLGRETVARHNAGRLSILELEVDAATMYGEIQEMLGGVDAFIAEFEPQLER
jgi:hypothetical protein